MGQGTTPEPQPLFSGHKSKRKVLEISKWYKKIQVLDTGLSFLLSATALGEAHLPELFAWGKTSPQGLTSASKPSVKLFHPCFPAEAKLPPAKVTSKEKGSVKHGWRSGLLSKADVLTLQLMCWSGLCLLSKRLPVCTRDRWHWQRLLEIPANNPFSILLLFIV